MTATQSFISGFHPFLPHPLSASGENALPKSEEVGTYSYSASKASKIWLSSGDSLTVEPSAMLACENLELTTGFHKSVFEVAKRYFFGGEALFQNTFSVAKGKEKGWIALEEGFPGQIGSYDLKKGDELTLAKGSYVASDTNVKIQVLYNGVLGWMQGMGISKFKAVLENGEKGKVFFNSSQGVIKALEIQKGNPVLIDNNNLIGHTKGVKLFLQTLGSVRSTLFSGEGIVAKAEGEGVVFIGSGESSVRKNTVEKVTSILVKSLLPNDPALWMNRATVIALVYVASRSHYMTDLAHAIRYLGGMIFLSAHCRVNAGECQKVFDQVINGTKITN